MKVCAKCKENVKLNEFGKDKRRKDGLNCYCKGCVNICSTKYREENTEKVKNKHIRYSEENPEKLKKAKNKYKKNNIGKVNANTAKRRSQKLQATPPWLTKAQLLEIQQYYIDAVKLTKETGIPHHVDHIIPLQGESVRGLHVPWNLQILTAKENISKGNRIP